MSSSELDRVRRVALADGQADQPDHSGVLMLRPRALRWTDRFPHTAGYYWVRPKSVRYSTAVLYVPGGIPEDRFNDAEFSDRAIARPLEPGADDDAIMRTLGPSPYANDEPYEPDMSRSHWFLGGMCVGIIIGVVITMIMVYVVMAH